MPADPGRADRARLRALARGPRWRDRQGRRRDRDARRRHARCCSTRPARSRSAPRGPRDRPATVTGSRASCCGWPPRSTGCPPTCSARRSCARPSEAGLKLTLPQRRARGARPGHRGHRRRPPRGGRQPRVHARPRRPGTSEIARRHGARAAAAPARRTCIVARRRPRRRRDRDGRRAAPGRRCDRRAPAAEGDPPRRDGLRRPPLGRRAGRPRARRRPRLRRAVAGGQARGRAAHRAPIPSLRPVVMVGDGVNDAPRWRSPTSASRWARPAPRSPLRPQTRSSPSTGSTGSPTRSTPAAERSTSPARACSPAWG